MDQPEQIIQGRSGDDPLHDFKNRTALQFHAPAGGDIAIGPAITDKIVVGIEHRHTIRFQVPVSVVLVLPTLNAPGPAALIFH